MWRLILAKTKEGIKEHPCLRQNNRESKSFLETKENSLARFKTRNRITLHLRSQAIQSKITFWNRFDKTKSRILNTVWISKWFDSPSLFAKFENNTVFFSARGLNALYSFVPCVTRAQWIRKPLIIIWVRFIFQLISSCAKCEINAFLQWNLPEWNIS